MAELTPKSPAVVAFAQALLDLAYEQQQGEAIADELGDLAKIVEQDKLLKLFLLDPAISQRQRWDVLKRSLEGRINPLMLNFLGVLNAKGRFALLPQIVVAYGELLDRRLNRVRVEVTAVSELDAGELQEVRTRVSAALGKEAIIEQKIDPSIIGGLVVRVEDRLMDASVKAQLDLMRKQLLAARVV